MIQFYLFKKKSAVLCCAVPDVRALNLEMSVAAIAFACGLGTAVDSAIVQQCQCVALFLKSFFFPLLFSLAGLPVGFF